MRYLIKGLLDNQDKYRRKEMIRISDLWMKLIYMRNPCYFFFLTFKTLFLLNTTSVVYYWKYWILLLSTEIQKISNCGKQLTSDRRNLTNNRAKSIKSMLRSPSRYQVAVPIWLWDFFCSIFAKWTAHVPEFRFHDSSPRSLKILVYNFSIYW